MGWRLVNNLDSLWARVIIAIYGVEMGLDLKGYNFNGVWNSLTSSYYMLHYRNFLLMNTLCRKACQLCEIGLIRGGVVMMMMEFFSVQVTRVSSDFLHASSLTLHALDRWKILPR
ncbi:hypothetical protein Tco_0223814 [Tanacetum coccineum]